jgi:hypothetical protein
MSEQGYYFQFSVDNKTKFQCKVHCAECTAVKPDGAHCKRRVCIGSPYFYVHLMQIKHLRIKPSTLEGAGKGLFAMNRKAANDAVLFKKGDTIINYDGEVIDDEELEERYGNNTAPYALETKEDSNVDCACERGVGSSANSKPNHNNARISINRRKNEAKLVATKNIKNGEEIFLSYGPSFRFDERTSHRTVYRRKKPLFEDSDSDSD